MMVTQKEQSLAQLITQFIFKKFHTILVICAVISLVVTLTSPYAHGGVKANDVLIPKQLGEIQSSFNGVPDQPLIFIIGESHVSLKVQHAVADILGYLRGAYSVRLVCTEGYDKPLPVSRGGTLLTADRLVARSDFTDRRINAVEYVARVYPDLQVIGIEDMQAYSAHGQDLDKQQQELQRKAKQWGEDFVQFLRDDVGNLRVSRSDADRFAGALKKFSDDRDLDVLAKVLYSIVGRESKTGRKLTSLLERKKAIGNENQTMVHTPEMKKRDQLMVANTLRIAKAKKSSVAALVVGKLHLPGLEDEFRRKKVSYVTIIPTGLDEELKEGMTEKDIKVYEQWKKGEKTRFEEWLLRFKPEPSFGRKGFFTRSEILGALANADRMHLEGNTPNQILQVTNNAPQPGGFHINNVYRISGGTGIEFTANGKRAYAYFAGDPSGVQAGPGHEKVEEGVVGGRHYAIYDGGNSDREPPIPPYRGTGGSEPIPPDPSGDKIYLAAIERQKKDNPSAVTIRYPVEEGIVVRWVDDKRRVLGVLPEDVRAQARTFERSDLGPEKVFAAQKLADILLAQLDEDMPTGRTVLYQLSQNDMIGNLSLPFIAQLADDAVARSRLDNIREVYTIPWKEQQNLPDQVGQSTPRADIKRVVVLISDRLRKGTRYSTTLGTMRQAGAIVNETPDKAQTVILLGSYTDTDRTWSATMNDKSKVTLTSERLQRIIQGAENVVSLNTDLANQPHAKRIYSKRLEVGDEDVLDIGRRMVEQIGESAGRESIDGVLRRIAERPGLRELLTTKEGLKSLSGAVRTVIGIGEVSTVHRAG